MRKIFLYVFAAFILTSCDNLKKKDKSSSEDDTEETTTKKKKKPLDEENTDEEETPKKKKKAIDEDDTPVDDENTVNDNSDYETGWTQGDRTKFLKQCVTDAAANVGESRAKEYCSCFLKKVENKYSSYTVADRSMSEKELNSWAADCNK